VPSLPRAFTVCKETVLNILRRKRRQYVYQGHDYLHIQDYTPKMQAEFSPEMATPTIITEVHILSLIK